VQQAIACYEAALRVRTERDFPVDWAKTRTSLGLLYTAIPDGSRTENLKSAKACFEAALRIYTENTLPNEHRDIAARRAEVENQLRSLTSE
jgi:hypothetical protein